MTDKPAETTCKTCPWMEVFDVTEKQRFASYSISYNLKFIEDHEYTGFCRRHAPRASQYSHHPASRWPMVDGDYDWCGEHPDRKET